MAAPTMHGNDRYEKEMGIKKTMLWQTVADECVDADTNSLASTHGDGKRAGNLPSLLPGRAGSRSSMSTASTGRCSSRASSRCSSAYSVDSSACSMRSSRSGSTARSVTRPSKKTASPSLAGSDSTQASHSFKRSVWDAVQDDHDDKAPEVERIETRTEEPSRRPTELRALPRLVGVAWQDPEEAVASDSLFEREHFVLPPSDSRPQSRLSDVDDSIFGTNGGAFAANPFDDAADFQDGRFVTPAPPPGTRKVLPRPGGHRKLPPVSLEAAEAALSAVMNESTSSTGHGPSASSAPAAAAAAGAAGAEAGGAAAPAVKEAWVTPQQPQAPRPANRFTRPALRPQPSSSAVSDDHTKLSL